MAGNGALDLSIRIMGKVDPSLAKSISQVKGLTGSLTGGLRTTNSLLCFFVFLFCDIVLSGHG